MGLHVQMQMQVMKGLEYSEMEVFQKVIVLYGVLCESK
jgi:hypothetical protein